MVKISGKIRKHGNGYYIPVKKALLDSDVLKRDVVYEFELITNEGENGAVLGATSPEVYMAGVEA